MIIKCAAPHSGTRGIETPRLVNISYLFLTIIASAIQMTQVNLLSLTIIMAELVLFKQVTANQIGTGQ